MGSPAHVIGIEGGISSGVSTLWNTGSRCTVKGGRGLTEPPDTFWGGTVVEDTEGKDGTTETGVARRIQITSAVAHIVSAAVAVTMIFRLVLALLPVVGCQFNVLAAVPRRSSRSVCSPRCPRRRPRRATAQRRIRPTPAAAVPIPQASITLRRVGNDPGSPSLHRVVFLICS